MLLARAARKKAERKDGPIAGNTVASPSAPPDEQDQLASRSLDVKPPTPPVTLRRGIASAEGNDGLHAGAAAAPRLGAQTEVSEIGSQRVAIEDVRRLRKANQPVVILDVRTRRSLEGADSQAKGAVRLRPDHVAERAMELGLDKEDWLIAYCA